MSAEATPISDATPNPDATGGNAFDPKQTHVLHQWKYTSPLIACRFDPQGRFVFSCAEDNSIQRWDFPTGKLTRLEGHDSWVRDLVCLPDGQSLVSVGCDEQMLFWEAESESPKPLRKTKAHDGWIRCVDVSPNGQTLVTGGNDNRVKLWDAASGEQALELTGHDSHVYSVRFHPDGQSVLSGDLSGKVIQWDATAGKQLHRFDAKDLHTYNKGQKVDYGGVRSLAFSPDGKYLACGGLHKATNPLGAINEPLVVLFDWQTQEQGKSLVAEGVRGALWVARYLPDGTLLGASGGSGGGYLLFWNQQEEKCFHKFKLKDTARGMDLHADHLHVATTHWDRHLRISRMTAKAES